jgi:hypothetical protein
MATTVLAHIAASMPQKENLATEALAFILNGSPAARGALERQLSALVGKIEQVARVSTQIAIGEESRPDVVLLAEGGAPLGYIEAKFWAALTDAQPVEYVRRLSDARGGVLAFLAPERRLPTLHTEVRERLRSANLDTIEVVAVHHGGHRTNRSAELVQAARGATGRSGWRPCRCLRRGSAQWAGRSVRDGRLPPSDESGAR